MDKKSTECRKHQSNCEFFCILKSVLKAILDDRGANLESNWKLKIHSIDIKLFCCMLPKPRWVKKMLPCSNDIFILNFVYILTIQNPTHIRFSAGLFEGNPFERFARASRLLESNSKCFDFIWFFASNQDFVKIWHLSSTLRSNLSVVWEFLFSPFFRFFFSFLFTSFISVQGLVSRETLPFCGPSPFVCEEVKNGESQGSRSWTIHSP